MNRLLGGYAAYFNRRHGRDGHLFQNRFKSIVCQEDGYLLTLVRYIHLNPIRAKLVNYLKQLASYPYSGHRCLIGKANYPWQDTVEVLGLFGKTPSSSLGSYLDFMADGVQAHSLQAVYPNRNFELRSSSRPPELFDARVLGDWDFTKAVLKQREDDFEIEKRPKASYTGRCRHFRH